MSFNRARRKQELKDMNFGGIVGGRGGGNEVYQGFFFFWSFFDIILHKGKSSENSFYIDFLTFERSLPPHLVNSRFLMKSCSLK